MFCPVCKKAFTEAVSRCGTCGFEFVDELQHKLRFYFILKNELDYLISSGKQLDLRIQSLSGKLIEYQNEIQADIDELALAREKEREEIERPIPVEQVRQRAEAPPPRTSPHARDSGVLQGIRESP